MRTSHATPGPGPVKARLLDEAVTGRAVLPPPPPPEGLEGGDVVVERDAVVVVDPDGALVVVEPDGALVVVEPDGAVVVVTPEEDVVVVLPEVVVVVGGTVVVVVGVVVVVVVPDPAVAMTGAIGDADGVEVVMPDGVIVSLGYAVHVNDSGAPETMSVMLALESS